MVLRSRRQVFLTLTALGLTSTAYGQAPPAPQTFLLRDEGAVVHRLSANVFAILHEDATDEWPHGNTGVIVGRRSVFVIDSCYLPSRARADIGLIRQITDKPVSRLATTHWHMDHNNGAIAYRDAYPEVQLMSERETARWLELNQTYWRALTLNEGSPRRAAVEGLRQELAAGISADGSSYSEAERSRRARIIAQRENELSELAELTILRPEHVFDRGMHINFEGVRIEVRDWGPANSPHDVTFWLPHDRVLFTGDIVVRTPLPYMSSSWPVHWVSVLQGLEALPVATLVPGHGPIMHDHSYTRAMRGLIETALERVEAMIRQGRSLGEVQDRLNLDDVRRRTPEWMDEGVSEEDWRVTCRILAERSFVGIRGQGGR